MLSEDSLYLLGDNLNSYAEIGNTMRPVNEIELINKFGSTKTKSVKNEVNWGPWLKLAKKINLWL